MQKGNSEWYKASAEKLNAFVWESRKYRGDAIELDITISADNALNACRALAKALDQFRFSADDLIRISQQANQLVSGSEL